MKTLAEVCWMTKRPMRKPSQRPSRNPRSCCLDRAISHNKRKKKDLPGIIWLGTESEWEWERVGVSERQA